jgi:DNA mismatch repair protein MutS2
MSNLQKSNHHHGHKNSLTKLDWTELLDHVQKFATSSAGKWNIKEITPYKNSGLALDFMNQVFDASELVATGIRPHMESLDLFETWHSRLKKKAVLKTLEIKDVRSFCLESVALKEACKSIQNNWSQNVFSEILEASEPLSAIDQLMTPSGEIRSDASETLYQLFREKENLARQIQNNLDRLVSAHQMSSYLQDKYVTTREGRWVLPIRSGKQHSVSGVIHGSSQTKQTVFMEPEVVVPLNNRLRQVEVEIEEEIERLLVQISEYLAQLTEDFERSRKILLNADILLSIAQLTLLIEGQKISFSESEFLLQDVRHPLLQINDKKPISNTVRLNEQQSLLLLSGPNAGGKTVLLKAIGLAAQMARCGFPVSCRPGSQIPFFETIHIGIGDSQSVDAELSTFAAHLQILQEACNLKGNKNLILIDEICGSTDPEEGSALARSFIERIAHNKGFAVITSHLGPLKSGWTAQDKILSGSMEYDTKSGRPTYQYLPGLPGDSMALQTAKRAGVEPALIERALELLTPETRLRMSKLDEIEQMKSGLNQLQAELKKDQSQAQKEKIKYEELKKQFEKEKADLLIKVQREAERQIENLISQSKVENTFKRHAALQEIKNQLPEIIKSKPSNENSTNTQIQTNQEFAERYPTGSKIYVPHLQQDGIVQSSPSPKGEVFVLVGSMRLNLPWTSLKPPQAAMNPTAHLVRRSTGTTIALQNSEKIVDLRGQTVEDALQALESELDQAVIMKLDRFKVIHGHGTEALKKAVRTFLSRSALVGKWKSASNEQGGDGATWVELQL